MTEGKGEVSASPFQPFKLQQALGRAHGWAWSQPSTYRQTKVHHGYRRVVLVESGERLSEAARFGFALDRFEPVHTAWLSWIDPGGFVVPHSDAGPWRERWQIPIRAYGWFHQNGVRFEPKDGQPFPVTHWREHYLGNPTAHPRIHLVLDRDLILDLAATPFQTFPITDPDLRDLVASII